MKLTDAEKTVFSQTLATARIYSRDLKHLLAEKNFLFAQILVVVLIIGHDFTDRLGILGRLGELYNMSIALLFIPFVIIALNYRPVVSVITGLWALILSIPDWVFWHRTWDERLSVLLLLVAITGLAAFISRSINREKTARDQAIKSEGAFRASELKYRNLFESSPIPIIILSPNGIIDETNPAAKLLFGNNILPDVPKSLAGLLGQENAASLLDNTKDTRQNFQTFLIRKEDGTTVHLRPTVSFLSGVQNNVVQVILRDVTDEYNRHRNLKAYAAAVIEAREKERRRIARVIHDDSIQPLILLCRHLDNSARLGAASGPELTQELAGARKTVEDLVSQLREFTTELRPPALDDFGLVTAVRSLVREYRERYPANIELNVRGDYKRMLPETELGIFRIAQEAIFNAVRHSKASHLQVNLFFSPKNARLEVIDNGTGFSLPPTAQLINTGHFGLIGMQERADMFGGELFVESETGTGTKITVVMRLLKRGN